MMTAVPDREIPAGAGTALYLFLILARDIMFGKGGAAHAPARA